MKWLFFVLLAIKREQKSRTRKIVRTIAQQRLQKVLVPYHKLTDCSCFGRENRTHLEELAFVRFVRTGITLFFDLLQGLISSAVQLELEDVDIVGSFYNTISSLISDSHWPPLSRILSSPRCWGNPTSRYSCPYCNP